MTIHAFVGRARLFGYVLAAIALGFGVAARRAPENKMLVFGALVFGILGATLLLAAITHRALFRRIDIEQNQR